MWWRCWGSELQCLAFERSQSVHKLAACCHFPCKTNGLSWLYSPTLSTGFLSEARNWKCVLNEETVHHFPFVIFYFSLLLPPLASVMRFTFFLSYYTHSCYSVEVNSSMINRFAQGEWGMQVHVCDTLLMAFPMPRLPCNNPMKEIAPEMMEAQHTPHTCCFDRARMS